MRGTAAAAIARVLGPRRTPRSRPELAVWLLIVLLLALDPDLWLRGDAFLGLVRAEAGGTGPVLSGAPVDAWWETWRGNAAVTSWPQGTTIGTAAAVAALVAGLGEGLADRRVMRVGIAALGTVSAVLLAATVAFGTGVELGAAAIVAVIAAVTSWRLPPRSAP